jgi:hypothetical protein
MADAADIKKELNLKRLELSAGAFGSAGNYPGNKQ